MERLTQKPTAKQIYDNYINHPTTKDTFTLFYTKKIGDGKDIEIKGQKFESKDEDYCILLLESIINSKDFIGFPFGNAELKLSPKTENK